MIDWLTQNWHYILLGISTASIIFNIIFLIVRRVPLKKIIDIIKLVPDLINQAETMFPVSGYGSTKREIVKSLFNDLLIIHHCEKFAKYIDIDSLIEDFLVTPQKHEEV